MCLARFDNEETPNRSLCSIVGSSDVSPKGRTLLLPMLHAYNTMNASCIPCKKKMKNSAQGGTHVENNLLCLAS